MKICRGISYRIEIGQNVGNFAGRIKSVSYCVGQSAVICSVVRQQSKGNSFLRLLDNRQRFCIAESYVYVNKTTKRRIIAHKRQKHYAIRTVPV
jgi:bifunctional ADP-heptose synthase (sugar kinase/adenylyltransferase)